MFTVTFESEEEHSSAEIVNAEEECEGRMK
jgi:hypothetical protein